MKKQISIIVILVLTLSWFTGCAPSYSLTDHQPFTIKGNSSIKGIMVDDWKCDEVSLYPKTKYGLAVLRGSIRGNAIDSRYREIVRSVAVNDRAFMFENLPSGEYILKCTASRLIWMTAEEIVAAESILALDRLRVPGLKTAVKTSHGTFYCCDAQGNWEPSGAMVTQSKDIRDILTLSNGQRRVIALPPSDLWQASRKGHIEVVKLLLEAGADVNAAEKTFGFTSLYLASKNGNVEIVKLLLAAKADVNAADKEDGFTSLYLASKNGNVEIVKLLLAAKADVNAADKEDGFTSLYLASKNGNVEIVKLLLAAKADVNAADKEIGFTSLFVASKNGNVEIVKLLLAAKADVNAADKSGFTSMFVASEKGHSEIVKLMLAAGADVNAKAHLNGHDYTPLTAASGKGHVKIVKLLLEAGADVNAKTHKGGMDFTPLSIAKLKGHSEIIRLLIEYGAKD